MTEPHYYQFGSFQVDLIRHKLLRDGERIPLPGKAFDLLVALLQNSEKVVSREQLVKEVWGSSIVTDNNFNVTLRAVRKALSDSAQDPQYIVTLPEGYRFIVPVKTLRTEGIGFGLEGTKKTQSVDNLGEGSKAPVLKDYVSGTSGTRLLLRHALNRKAVITGVILLACAAGLFILQSEKRIEEGGRDTYTTNSTNQDHKEELLLRLTNHNGRDRVPAWSPTGEFIAFISNREHTTLWGDVWAVNPDGTNLRRLTVVPDSEFGIAEIAWLGNTGDLVVLETVDYHEFLKVGLSANPKLPIVRKVDNFESPFFSRLLIVPGRRAAHYLTPSRDGIRAAWVAMKRPYYTCPTVGEVRTALMSSFIGGDALGHGSLVTSSFFDCEIDPGKFPFEGISFSPNGSQIAVARNPDPKTFGYDIEIYNLDGILVQKITNDGGGSSSIINWHPAWSSDNRIAFASNRSGRQEIYIVNPDGSGLRQVTFNGGDWPSWSPDNTRIAFESERDGNLEIYIMRIAL